MISRFFEVREHNSTVPREFLAGLTTFLTMAYILVVQPAVLSKDFSGNPTGMDANAVLLATCFSSAFACLLMGVFARLPIALAPGMGTNFFFVSVVMTLSENDTSGNAWQQALGIVFVSGVLFLILTLAGFRRFVLEVMSDSMRNAIAVGIGAFVAFIGLKNAGVIVDGGTLVQLNAKGLTSDDSLVFWLGLITTLILMVRRIPGGILAGIVVSTLTAVVCDRVTFDQVAGLPDIVERAAFRFRFDQVTTVTGLSFIAVFLFMDIFDTTGTLIGVSQQANIIRNGQVPCMREAMIADSAGTMVGACLGTSTVTSFIESAAGVQQGGRTGLTAVTVGCLFLLAIPLSPVFIALGQYSPITAPALVAVGAMMFRNVRHIDWADDTEAIPAFFVILAIPLFFSIADGIALGLIVWPILKLVRGRRSDISFSAWALALLLIAYFLTVRGSH